MLQSVFLHLNLPAPLAGLRLFQLVLCHAAFLFDVSLWSFPDVSNYFLRGAGAGFGLAESGHPPLGLTLNMNPLIGPVSVLQLR